MQGTNNMYSRHKVYGTSNHINGASGLSMQTVQDMAGVSGSYMNMNTFSTKDYSDTIMFDTKRSIFSNFRFRRYKKRYAGLFGFAVFVCFIMGLFWILFSTSNSKNRNISIFEDDHLKITHDDIGDVLESHNRDLNTGDWSDFEEDWIDEHDFVEEEIDDIEDIEHGRSHYAKVLNNIDNEAGDSLDNNSIDSSLEGIRTTDDSKSTPISTDNDNNELPAEIQGSVPPKPLTRIPVYEESIVYFPRTIHLLGRVGAHSSINGKYTVMMHPYHEESPWIHGGRLIWYKLGKETGSNYYIFYESKLHNWILTDRFDLSNPSPIAFLPDHGVMPVKDVGKHGCKAQHYWYFREKQNDKSYKLVIDRSVLVTDNGILLDSLSDRRQQNDVFSGSSSDHNVIGLRLHKNQVHIDHKYYSNKYSSSYSASHNIQDPYIDL